MIERVLLAVDDSAASLAAVRLATELCARWSAMLFVTSTSTAGPATPATADPTAQARGMLGYAARIAQRHGVKVGTELIDGEAAPAVLDQCEKVGADLIVIGRSRNTGCGQPYIGSQARHILEFANVPVIVVPPPSQNVGHP